MRQSGVDEVAHDVCEVVLDVKARRGPLELAEHRIRESVRKAVWDLWYSWIEKPVKRIPSKDLDE